MTLIIGVTTSWAPSWSRVTPVRKPSSITGVAVVFSMILTPCFSARVATWESRSLRLITPPQLGKRECSGHFSSTYSSPA